METLPPRRHFIPEWAVKFGLRRADLARATGADKATVTRWFKGTAPQDQYLMTLAKLFDASVPDLFRHPDEVWVSRFLEGRSETEIQRIKATLEAAFPR
ncbi:helix-turn-helix domain-containing protein [Methylorubrum sp. POS3]|uniref:helix-turn-helix domain-containing protein n=1 Tax=Methylorubrum sp. POS3 TaxID=2998492 RepID=UPI00372C7873